MGFDVFTVSLTTNAPVYFSGQEIKGVVRANLSSEVPVETVTVGLRGIGKVAWTEHLSKRSISHDEKEEYGVQSVIVWYGSASNNILRAGSHTFHFSFVIPHNIPSSFKTSNGSVQYEVRAVANRKRTMDETSWLYINVHQIYDLNENESNRHPLHVKLEEDDLGCCTCAKGLVSFELSTDHAGYVPGQKIMISGRIINSTLSTIKYTEAKIVQTMKLHAGSTKTETITVQRVYRPSILAGREDVWSAVPLTVPAIAPSGFRYCKLIDIDYELKFTAKIGWGKSLTATTSLIIGSVPLKSESHGAAIENRLLQQNMGPSPSSPSAPLAPRNEHSGAPPPYSDPAPPSYTEYKFKTGPHDVSTAIAGSDDEGGFAPRYVEKTGYSKL